MYNIKDKIEGGSPFTNRNFMCDAFQYPAPGTDFTPEQKGAALAQSKTGSKVWVPLNMLRPGDELVSYRVIGVLTSGGGTVTVDAKIAKIAKAGTVTNLTGGAITQVSKTGAYIMDEECTITTKETVATDYMYNIEIAGTTAASTTIKVVGIELRFNRKG